MGALGYNAKKFFHPDENKRAELLDTNFTSLSFDQIKTEVNWVRQLRPGLGKYVYHTSLNFLADEADKLSNDKLLTIAHQYLSGMGFTNNQYLIFRHRDADHPHVHILANRITFDGDVVSDSNNYKRSEALLRALEKEHDLLPVEQSSYAALGKPGEEIKIYKKSGKLFHKAPKNAELEMAGRQGKPSDKMLLQEKLSLTLKQPKLSLQDFIQQCEAQGIYLLFNQAATGHVSGITYFHGDFKAKGQALGSRFKWTGLIRQLDYEQVRDSKAISEASERAKAIYGDFAVTDDGRPAAAGRKRNDEPVPGGREVTFPHGFDPGRTVGPAGDLQPANQAPAALAPDLSANPVTSTDPDLLSVPDIQISIADDIDDEAILGRNRKRQGKARKNSR